MTVASPPQVRLHDIVAPYYRAWFRYHPEAAVDAGVPGYAQLLTPFAASDMGALVCLNDELVVGLDEINSSTLDADEAIDYRVVRASALLENEYLLDVEPRAPDPARLLPVNAIYQLMIRPVENFAGALSARLRAIPGHMRHARDYLRPRAERIPPLWLRSGVTAARHGAEFIVDLRDHAKVAECFGASGVPVADFMNAAAALNEYADFLERELQPRAAGDFACGAAYFGHLLRHRHFLDVTPDRLRAFGQQLFEHTRTALQAACRAWIGTDDVGEALRRIRQSHPPADKMLDFYRAQMQAARRFVVEHDLVGIPAREQLDVIDTPVFMRHQIPFAAYSEPSPTDLEQRGRYYVTPPADAEQLAEHDSAGVMHTCVHEAWPGHHLQFVTANSRPASRSLPRLLNPSATLYEGWALYCEQLMHEQGFLDRPEQRIILLRDRLWRALRIVIDVGLHTERLSIDDAADSMVQHLGFARSQALADITWYTRSPTVPSGYATGWALIVAAREQLSARDPGFTLRRFHDQLLAAGSIGAPLVIERMFGPELSVAVHSQVFTESAHATS